MFSRADTNENMEVEDDVNKTLPEDRSEDEEFVSDEGPTLQTL